MCKIMYAHVSINLCTFRDRMDPLFIISIWFSWFFESTDERSVFNAIKCIYKLTYQAGPASKKDMSLSPEKKKSLQTTGTLNPHPETVHSELFSQPFFDPHDRIQVKYEMLRAQQVERLTITEVCRQFGFSRESFYYLRKSFQQQGFNAFLPAKRGRKGPTKLKGELLEFALNQKRADPDIDPGRLTELIAQHYGVEVHRTTVLRGLKKKLSASRGSDSRVEHRRR